MRDRLLISLIAAIIILSFLWIVFFVGLFQMAPEENNFNINNEYYGFQLQVPSGWIAKKDANYSDMKIADSLEKCRQEKTLNEMGLFRFESRKYELNFPGLEKIPDNSKTGAILEISVRCFPNPAGLYWATEENNFKIGGEMVFKQEFVSDGFGKSKLLYFFDGDFQYSIAEYIYIAESDRSREAEIKEGYIKEFEKIEKSFQFIK